VINKSIVRNIVLARVASDGGKNITSMKYILPPYSISAWKNGYQDKDMYIRKAISTICDCHGKSGFSFSVQIDKESKADFLVYFTFRVDGKRRQVSFHSYDTFLERFVDTSDRHHTRWNRKMVSFTVAELASLIKEGTL